MLLPWGGVSVKTTLIGFSFVAISLLAASSHIRAMLTDPGAVPIEFTPGNLFHEQVSARPPASMAHRRPGRCVVWGLIHSFTSVSVHTRRARYRCARAATASSRRARTIAHSAIGASPARTRPPRDVDARTHAHTHTHTSFSRAAA